jgi:hypothetical protein
MMIEQTLRLLLDGIGRSEEYEFYLSRFRTYDTACFCFLIPDAVTTAQAGSSILANLDFLLKLDLFPGLLFAGASAFDERVDRFLRLDAQQNVILEVMPHVAGEAEAAEARAHRRIPVFRMEQPLEAAVQRLSTLSRRFHFLRLSGMVRTAAGVTPYVDPAHPPAGLSTEDAAFSEFAGSLLSDGALHVSLCAPVRLLHEIFTVKGSGTVFRPGFQILHPERSAVDEPRLKGLLEASFGRKLRNPEFLAQVSDFYIEENYEGAVLLEPVDSMMYLSKFAVSTLQRGEGLAQDLWRAVAGSGPLFWRARKGSSVERWYVRIADGVHRTDRWNVYWKDMPPENIASVIRYCVNREEDFESA